MGKPKSKSVLKGTKGSFKGLKGSKGGKSGQTFIPKEERLDLDDSVQVERAIHVNVPEDGNKDTKKKKKNLAKDYQGELDDLAATDPEFHAFLQQNDPSMLTFARDDDSDDDEIDDEEEEDDDDEMEVEDSDDEGSEDGGTGSKGKSGSKGPKTAIVVTPEVMDAMLKKSRGGSMAGLKSMLTAFRSACIPSSDVEKDATAREYVLPTPASYQTVMTTVMGAAHEVIYQQLGLAPNARPSQSVLQTLGKHPKWKKLQMQVLGFFKSVLHVLASLADSNLNAEISVFLLSHLEPYLFLLAPLPRLVKGVLKVLLGIWSQPASAEEDSLNARGYAFLRIRQIAMNLPGTAMDECMRCIYLSYARNCRTYSEQNNSSIHFMIESVVQIYSVDKAMAYQHTFLFVRQLALHLRAAMIKKSAEKSKELVGWQFVNCIRLWTHVICAMPEDDALGQLIYPLTQVIQGVLLAATSPQGLPLRFYLVEFLQRLAAHSQMFIPTFRTTLEVLEFPEFSGTKHAGSTDAPPDFAYMTRLPKGSLSKNTVRNVVVEHVCTAVRREAEIYRFHVGFPEYVFLTIRRLKMFVKKCKNSKWRDMIRTLVGTLEKYCNEVKTARTARNINPMDVSTFEPLLPAGQKTCVMRLMKLIGSANKTSVTGMSEVVLATEALASKKVAMPNKKMSNVASDDEDGDADDARDGDDGEENDNDDDDDDDDSDDDADDDDNNSGDNGEDEDQLTSFQDWSDSDD